MSIPFYQVLHTIGNLMIFLGFGALIAHTMSGSANAGVRKLGSITSGVGLLLSLVAGFGLIAKYSLPLTAPWLLVKMAAWLGLGGLTAAILRAPGLAILWWGVALALGFLAVYTVYVGRYGIFS